MGIETVSSCQEVPIDATVNNFGGGYAWIRFKSVSGYQKFIESLPEDLVFEVERKNNIKTLKYKLDQIRKTVIEKERVNKKEWYEKYYTRFNPSGGSGKIIDKRYQHHITSCMMRNDKAVECKEQLDLYKNPNFISKMRHWKDPFHVGCDFYFKKELIITILSILQLVTNKHKP